MMRFIAILLFIGALVVSSCENKNDNLHAPFQGLWKLYIIEVKDTTGTWKEHSWNKGGDSYILYDGIGHMAVQITPANYSDKEVKAPRTPIDSLSIEELRADLKTYSSNYVYTANCKIFEKESIIEHHRLSHSYPFDWGVVAQRRYEFKGDTLILMPVEPQNPFRLKWIKQP